MVPGGSILSPGGRRIGSIASILWTDRRTERQTQERLHRCLMYLLSRLRRLTDSYWYIVVVVVVVVDGKTPTVYHDQPKNAYHTTYECMHYDSFIHSGVAGRRANKQHGCCRRRHRPSAEQARPVRISECTRVPTYVLLGYIALRSRVWKESSVCMYACM